MRALFRLPGPNLGQAKRQNLHQEIDRQRTGFDINLTSIALDSLRNSGLIGRWEPKT
jgi:hypothetical protein